MKLTFNAAARAVEVSLIFATVFYMYRGYALQEKMYEMQTRPYAFFYPEFDIDLPADKLGQAYNIKIKNSGSFPATDLKTCVYVVIDGEPRFGFGCEFPPITSERESRELFAKLKSCSYSMPPFKLNDKEYDVCLLSKANSRIIPPGSDFSEKFFISREHFRELIANSDNPDSGILIGASFNGIKGNERYFSQLAFIPYRVTGGFEIKVQ